MWRKVPCFFVIFLDMNKKPTSTKQLIDGKAKGRRFLEHKMSRLLHSSEGLY